MLALAHTSSPSLEDIHADVWHAHTLAQSTLPVRSTGDVALDAQLPGGGWPVGAMTEILQRKGVHSEWRLLLPALLHCDTVVLVGAPQVPFAPALAAQGLRTQQLLWVRASDPAQSLWASEQALRCADVDAVLAWLPHTGKVGARSDQLRRLQMAAAGHSKLLFVMRPDAAQAEASPAVLRLLVDVQSSLAGPDALSDALQVQVLKRKGPPLTNPVQVHARASRLRLLLAASQTHALDRTAACT
jgi:protein ImuA